MSSAGDRLRLRRSMGNAFDKREPNRRRFRATIGDGAGNVRVPGKKNYVYMRRVGRSLVEDVLNVEVPARNGMPVICGADSENPDTLQVLAIDWQSIKDAGSLTYLPMHHESHELLNPDGGDDVVWVQKPQLVPLAPFPTSPTSMQIWVQKDFYAYASTLNYWPGGLTIDFFATPTYLPHAYNGVYVTVYVRGVDNTLQYTLGTEFPTWPPPAEGVAIPAPPIGSVPIVAVYLSAGPNLLTNDPGLTTDSFETPGAGPPVFLYWSENLLGGAVVQDNIFCADGGAFSCKITEGGAATNVYQDITVVPGDNRQLRFWNYGDGANEGRYSIYDVTNAADIVAITATGHSAAGWLEITQEYTVPAGCITVRISFYCPVAGGSDAWFDGVTDAQVPSSLSWGAMRDIRQLSSPMGGSVTPLPHDILSASHGDSTPAAVVRGDLMTGQGVAPVWTALPAGLAHELFKMDGAGNESLWAAFDWGDISAAAGVDMVHDHSVALEGGEVPLASLGSYTQGDLIIGGGADWTDLAIGGVGTYLRSDGADPSWQAIQPADIAHNLLSATHSDTVVSVVTQGDLVVGTAAGWDDLARGTAHQLLKMNVGGTDPAWASFAWDDISAAAAADMVHDHSVILEGGIIPATSVEVDYLGDPVYKTVMDWWDVTQSAGRVSGGAITDAYPLINVALGTGVVKTADAHADDPKFFDWPNVNGLNPALGHNWVYVDYNAGVPTVKVTAVWTDIDRHTQFAIAELWDTGAAFHILPYGQNVYDGGSSRAHRNLEQVFGFKRGSGLIVTESGAARTVDVSAGFMYRGLNQIPQAHIDTDPGGAADTFTAFYRDGGGGWTLVAGEDDISNTQYDDGVPPLGNLGVGRYGVFWVYLDFDNHLYIQYGQGNYKLAQAEAAAVPETMPFLSSFAKLIARVIVLQGAPTFYSVAYPWGAHFDFADVADHGNLDGLQDNDHDFYQSIRYVSVLSSGVLTEHADPDDAFTGAGAGDTIYVPPGTWACSAAHAIADIDIIGTGPPEACILQCTVDVGLTFITITDGATQNVTYEYSINKAAQNVALVVGNGGVARDVIGIATNTIATTTGIQGIGTSILYDCQGYATGAGPSYGISTASVIYYCYGYAEAGTVNTGAGIALSAGTAFGCRGVGSGTSNERVGIYVHPAQTGDAISCWADGDDADLFSDTGATLNICDCQYETTGGPGDIVHINGDRAGKAADETITGVWTFDEEITQAEQADPGGPGAGYARLYPKDVAGQTKYFFQDDAGEVYEITSGVEDLTITVGAAGDFVAIQDAIDWFKHWQVKGDCKIETDEDTYDERLDFSDMTIVPGSTLTVEGDNRLLAATSYFDGVMSNREALNNVIAGTTDGVISLVGNNGQPVITVTNAGANNPDFDADNWVNGDKILVYEWAAGPVWTATEYTIDSVLNNAITLTGNLVNGGVSTLGVGDDGAGITLLPNRRLQPTADGIAVLTEGVKGPQLDGFYVEPNTNASHGVNAKNGGMIVLERVVVRDASYGVLSDWINALVDGTGRLAVWECGVGVMSISTAITKTRYVYAIECTHGQRVERQAYSYPLKAVAINCTDGYRCDRQSYMYPLEATARHCTLGYRSIANAMNEARQTGNQNNGNTADYLPLPAGAGQYAESAADFGVLFYSM